MTEQARRRRRGRRRTRRSNLIRLEDDGRGAEKIRPRLSSELPANPPHELRDRLYPAESRKFISPGSPTVHATGEKTRTEEARREEARGPSEEQSQTTTRAIFSARVVKQQKIINHRDFYSAARAEINLIT